jgi:hypothetical protein
MRTALQYAPKLGANVSPSSVDRKGKKDEREARRNKEALRFGGHMSIAGIPSNLFQNSIVQETQNRFQQIQSQFQKLGHDLQSGNLTQAQSDYAALTHEFPNGGLFATSAAVPSSPNNAAPTSVNSNPIFKALQTLGKDLQSGNLIAAQQDFAAIQQSAQESQTSGEAHHNHHPHSSGSGDADAKSPISTLIQDFHALGQDLQSGNLAIAQQAYASLQTDLQQRLPNVAAISAGNSRATATSTSGVSVTA